MDRVIETDRQLSSRTRPRNAESEVENARIWGLSRRRGKHTNPPELVDQMRDSAMALFGDGYRGEMERKEQEGYLSGL